MNGKLLRGRGARNDIERSTRGGKIDDRDSIQLRYLVFAHGPSQDSGYAIRRTVFIIATILRDEKWMNGSSVSIKL